MKNKLLSAVAVVAMIAVTSSANLLTNPTFDPVNVGWQGFDSVWSPANGNATIDAATFATSAGGVATVTPSDWGTTAEFNFYQEFIGTLASGNYTFSVDAANITADGGPTVFVKEFDGGWGWIGWTPVAMTAGANVINFTAAAGNIYQLGFLTNGNTAGSYDVSNPSLVPEPATMGLLGIFGGALMFFRRRSRG
jgi:hypothetical protein